MDTFDRSVAMGKTRETKFKWIKIAYRVVSLLPFFVLGYVIFILPGVVRSGFGLLLAYLPLTLPIVSVVMAVMLAPKELNKLDGWINLTGQFALGFVSFAIWYVVASQVPSDYIFISKNVVIKSEYSVLLLISAFVWAGFCSVISMLNDKYSESPAFSNLRLMLFTISVALLFLPWALFEKKTDVEKVIGSDLDATDYAVSIPYRDASLNQYIGRITNPIDQVYVFGSIRAKSEKDAVAIALTQFRKLSNYNQTYSGVDKTGNRIVRNVEVLTDRIVAAKTADPYGMPAPPQI